MNSTATNYYLSDGKTILMFHGAGIDFVHQEIYIIYPVLWIFL
jgi:hypothetical protein